MERQHQHLGWERPFSIEFAERLRAETGAGGGYDHCLVWVPSSRAGRHILNELFSDQPGETEAFHPPRLITPARFVRSLLAPGAAIASEPQRLHAWKTILEQARAAAIQPVFPVTPRENTSAWAYTVAQQLMRLRARLAEDRWDFRKVAAHDLPRDRDRWAALGELEQGYLDALERLGLRDPDNALKDILTRMPDSLPYTRVLVAGVLNLSHRQAAFLTELGRLGMEIRFYLPVPPERAGEFDEWGRPQPGKWDREPLPEDLLAGRIQRAAEPRELAEQILRLSADYGRQVDALLVGSPEPELADYLIERSQLTRTPFYAPEGRALGATGWGRLIRLLGDWQQRGALATLFDLLNHSLFRNWAAAREIPVVEVQCALQEILKTRMLQGYRQMLDPALGPSRAIAAVRACLERMDQDGLNQAGTGDFPARMWKLLAGFAGVRQLSHEAAGILRQLEELLQDLQADFDPAATRDSDYWELFKFQLANTQFYPDRGEEERPVSGWLEIPWESAPHIVLMGLPDAQVPGPRILDSFLTPVLCRTLGLYGPDELAAFHAFRLRLILESRRNWGRVDILLPDRGLDDYPVQPSRFLFLAGEADILNRVELLIGERSGIEKPLPAEFGARLKPPPSKAPAGISVTGFRAYLQNPFHFYLQQLNYWSAPEALPREMDAMGFGSLAHRVLERLNSSDDGIALLKEKEVAAFLLTTLEMESRAVYGPRLPVPLQIQLGSLAERLRAAAPLIAAQRRAGWVPQRVEWRFHADLDFQIDGVPLRGVIDLLERNQESGTYRIVDYKTSDKGADPEKNHLTFPNASSREPLFPECDFICGNKRARWKDLQLPLYQRAVELLTGESATCAYFNLCKAVGEICLAEWQPTREQGAAAMACAEAIVKRVKAGQFAPVDRSTYEDPWLKWFGGDYAATLDPAWQAQHGRTLP